MIPEPSLEGWRPVIGRDASLEEVVDLAFDYRGDVTITLARGEVTGYVCNRGRDGADPTLDVLDPDGARHRLRYADVRAIAFTGKDPAAGKSYEAWRRRKSGGPPDA